MSVILLIVFVCVSYLIVRIGAIALEMTGMDRSRARFQALSAFTGTGFTTRETEMVINHPRRRKIVTYLMILGNAGIGDCRGLTVDPLPYRRSSATLTEAHQQDPRDPEKNLALRKGSNRGDLAAV